MTTSNSLDQEQEIKDPTETGLSIERESHQSKNNITQFSLRTPTIKSQALPRPAIILDHQAPADDIPSLLPPQPPAAAAAAAACHGVRAVTPPDLLPCRRVFLALRLLQTAHDLPTPVSSTAKPPAVECVRLRRTTSQPNFSVGCTQLGGHATSRELCKRYYLHVCYLQNSILPRDRVRTARPRDFKYHLSPRATVVPTAMLPP